MARTRAILKLATTGACRVCAQARHVKARKPAAGSKHGDAGSKSGLGIAQAHKRLFVAVVNSATSVTAHAIALACNLFSCVLGHDTEHVSVQKTVPLVSTPADADLEQHEVSHDCQ